LRLDSKPVLIFAYVIAAAVVGAFLFLLFREASHDTAQIGARPADRVVLQLQAALQGKGSRSAGIYRARNFAPIWVSDRGLTADARETIAILAAAGEEGLPAHRYRLPAPPTANARDTVKAGFELQMTDAVLRYASDMRWGAFQPRKLFDDVSLPREADDIAGRLVAAAQSGNVHAMLRALEPQSREYALLKAALKSYRARNPWPTVMAGTSPENLRRLQTRLQAENYLPAGPAKLPSAVILAGLRAYQGDSGLTADGKLTDRTVAMLNIPPLARADQIAANLERWRWLPRDMGRQYVMINVPDASLAVV